MAVVPVYNILAVPGASIPLSLERFDKMIGRVPVSGERVTLIFMKEDKTREELTADDFYPIGVSGTVVEVGEQGVLVFRSNTRVDLKWSTSTPITALISMWSAGLTLRISTRRSRRSG